MSAHAYYAEERERWPQVSEARLHGRAVIELALLKLARKFNSTVPDLVIRGWTGGGHYKVGRAAILVRRVNTYGAEQKGLDVVCLRTVLHEFAHHLHYTKTGRRDGQRWHGKVHRRWMDKACQFATEQGWLDGALEFEVVAQRQVVEAIRTARRDEQRQQAAAEASDYGARIAHKENLISGLERKIGRLESVIKRHRRSIAALRRAAARKG